MRYFLRGQMAMIRICPLLLVRVSLLGEDEK